MSSFAFLNTELMHSSNKCKKEIAEVQGMRNESPPGNAPASLHTL